MKKLSPNRIFPMLFSACLLLLTTCVLYSQEHDIRFEHVSIEAGLSHLGVTTICQDSRGFLWVATYDGLNRYDGYNFVNYSYDANDPNSLSSNIVLTIYCDNSGDLWIGTINGLDRYDRLSEKIISYKHDPNNPASISGNVISAIFQDSSGTLWIGTSQNGLNSYIPKDNQFERFRHNSNDHLSLRSNRITSICEDSSGNLWIGTTAGLDRFDRSRGSFIHYDSVADNIITIQRSSDGQLATKESKSYSANVISESMGGVLWLGTQEGLYTLDRTQDRFVKYNPVGNGGDNFNDKSISAVHEDATGKLWVGTPRSGLYVLDLSEREIINFRHNPTNSFSLSSDEVRGIYRDTAEVLWIATSMGLNKYHKDANKFVTYQHIPGDKRSLPGNGVHSIYLDRKDLLYVVSNTGLSVLDEEAGGFNNYRTARQNPVINVPVLVDRSGIVWLGTSEGLFSFNPVTQESKKHLSFPKGEDSGFSRMFTAIVVDDSEHLWLGTDSNGLVKFEKKSRKYTQYLPYPDKQESLSNNRIFSILKDRENTVWVGTYGGYLNRLDRENGSFTRFDLSQGFVGNILLSIFEDSGNRLWVGTRRGLLLFDRADGSYTAFREEDGLPSNTVAGIVEDKHGMLWLATVRGLSRFNPVDEEFRNYSIKDGLISNDLMNGIVYSETDDKVYIATDNGLISFSPPMLTPNLHSPPVVITDLRISNISVKPGVKERGEIILNNSIIETTELNLSPGNNFLTFEFAALDFVNPLKNEYSYIMEGMSSEWANIGTTRSLSFLLQPGEYVFRLRGSNNDLVWNTTGTSVRITIRPPFWDTWMFRFMIFVILVFSIFAAHLIRTQLLRKRNLELSKLNEDLRELNVYLEMFDYSVSNVLRVPVRHIGGYSQVIKDNYGSKLDGEFNAYLNKIIVACKDMKGLIDDLLRLSRSGREKLNIEKVDMSLLASATSKKVKKDGGYNNAQIVIEDGVEAVGDIRLLTLALNNLFDNAFKYSSKNPEPMIEFGSYEDDGMTVFYVKDNGIGFSPDRTSRIFVPFHSYHAESELEGTGLSLPAVERIIKRHGGKIWAEGKVDEGATIYFTLGNKPAI